MADRPYLFYELTNSICTTCFRKVEAKIVLQEGKVFMHKRCPRHGFERVLISTDADYYQRSRLTLKPGQLPCTPGRPDHSVRYLQYVLSRREGKAVGANQGRRGGVFIMNENPNSPLPPSGPEPSPLPPPPRALPGFWGMFGLGIVLIILSCISAAVFQSPFPFLLGAMAAVASVFFRGYRGIFVGYASTIGVVLLAVVILCGTGIIPGFHE